MESKWKLKCAEAKYRMTHRQPDYICSLRILIIIWDILWVVLDFRQLSEKLALKTQTLSTDVT